jgi:hypothetical protein
MTVIVSVNELWSTLGCGRFRVQEVRQMDGKTAEVAEASSLSRNWTGKALTELKIPLTLRD